MELKRAVELSLGIKISSKRDCEVIDTIYTRKIQTQTKD